MNLQSAHMRENFVVYHSPHSSSVLCMFCVPKRTWFIPVSFFWSRSRQVDYHLLWIQLKTFQTDRDSISRFVVCCMQTRPHVHGASKTIGGHPRREEICKIWIFERRLEEIWMNRSDFIFILWRKRSLFVTRCTTSGNDGEERVFFGHEIAAAIP